ncbi:DUF177 domain-containing protein [Roseovarius sp. CAU 1744]|uniref:YceD family protein n=1 Tax=Roseovarius sp. CAU 1744 TaxID=3140368 RepID=UPI00325B07EE
MPEEKPQKSSLRVADLPQNRETRFRLTPDDAQRQRIAEDLGILSLRKLIFDGHVRAQGRNDWQLVARLGATAEQSCVVTLEPVVTRIDQEVMRNFIAEMPADPEEEAEMPEDDSREQLGPEIDLIRVMTEALALALPDYPRRDDAALENAAFSAPGVTPMTDAEAKPFAGLAQLRDKLGKGE